MLAHSRGHELTKVGVGLAIRATENLLELALTDLDGAHGPATLEAVTAWVADTGDKYVGYLGYHQFASRLQTFIF